MKTEFTFSREQLTDLLRFAMATFAKQDDVFDFSPDNRGKPDAIKAVMAVLDNDIPFDGSSTEEGPTCPQCGYGNLEQYEKLPLVCPHCWWESDNISPAALGLQPEA